MGYVQHFKPLDYETTQSYSLTLRASDINDKYSDKRVTITVTDTNDNEPDFYGKDSRTNFLYLSLLEGNYTGAAGNGKEVDQFRAFDNDRTSPNNQIVSYRIEDTKSLFTIDSTTGWLYTKQAFDREDPNGCSYTLNVIAVDGAPSARRTDGQPNTGHVIVKVTIKDVNDNPPTFPQTSYTVFAPEDLFIGSRILNRTQPDTYYRIQANDPDSDAVLTYSVRPLWGQSVPFNIQPQTGFLTVAGLLDFDAGPWFQSYTFLITVDDTKFSNSATVTVTVTDVNDDSPLVGNYNFDNFTENDPNVVGVIATINSSDKDNGGINEFYYELKFTDTAVDAQYFSIGRRNGQLSIVKPLDRDFPKGKEEFFFTVEVADGDRSSTTNPPRYGFGEVTVRPNDVNDNRPIFPEDSRRMTVMENQPNGTRVGRVAIVDYDDGVNAQSDLIIIQQTPAPIVRLREPDRNELETTTVIDREVQETYLIVVQATDRGNPRLTGTGTLTITVGDENDNAPMFNVTYKFVLSESQKTGEVGRIQAYDKDKRNNAELTYFLANEDTTYFKMDQDRTLNQGILKIFKAVDFDDLNNLQRSFNLTAYAVDLNPCPNNDNSAETKIETQVTDYNDDVPTFVEREKTASVSEAATVGTTLATFSANDRDVNPAFGMFDCKEHYIKSGDTCIPKDYCTDDTPCFGDATCTNNIPPGPGEMPYICSCTGDWYGPLCQCHLDLKPSGMACELETRREENNMLSDGEIAGIIVGILLVIVVAVVVVWLVRCRKKDTDKKKAGEQISVKYDLNRTRRPDYNNQRSTNVRVLTTPVHRPEDRMLSFNGPYGAVGDLDSPHYEELDSVDGYESLANIPYEGTGSYASLETSPTAGANASLKKSSPAFVAYYDLLNTASLANAGNDGYNERIT